MRRDAQRARASLGIGAAALMAAGAGMVWGRRAALAALALGVVATGIQLLAARMSRRLGTPATPDHPLTYAVGMGLRVAGIAVLWLLVTSDRAAFPPGAAALGYLGTLLPLLWLETRLT